MDLARSVVPSEEWLQGAFWRRQAASARALLRRGLSVAMDDGEGDLDAWLDQQVPPPPLPTHSLPPQACPPARTCPRSIRLCEQRQMRSGIEIIST